MKLLLCVPIARAHLADSVGLLQQTDSGTTRLPVDSGYVRPLHVRCVRSLCPLENRVADVFDCPHERPVRGELLDVSGYAAGASVFDDWLSGRVGVVFGVALAAD